MNPISTDTAQSDRAAFESAALVNQPVQMDDANQTANFFYSLLLDEMREGVIFIDSNCVITRWNQSAEVLTGLSSQMMFGKELKPSGLTLSKPDGTRINDNQCPFRKATG